MLKVSIIGVDLAKNVFQLHGAAADGSVVFRKKLSRPLFERFMADHPPCVWRWRLVRARITGRVIVWPRAPDPSDRPPLREAISEKAEE